MTNSTYTDTDIYEGLSAVEYRLSNPAYTQLIVQLDLARRHLEAVKSIANELCRDHMLDESECCDGLDTMASGLAYMRLRVRERALR